MPVGFAEILDVAENKIAHGIGGGRVRICLLQWHLQPAGCFRPVTEPETLAVTFTASLDTNRRF